VNLVNAPNALAGVSTYEMFRDGDLRAVWAASVDEAGAVLAKVGVVPRSPRDAENAKIRHLSTLLRVPWFLLGTYLYLAGRKLDGKTSMLQDLEARRETEVDYITGAVSAWARQLGVATPVCDRLAALVRQAQAGGQGSPGMRPAALRAAVGL
jgi:2-dehydropantoate 2-reductase